jgi:hypothetical protein
MHRHRDPGAPLERGRQCASRYRPRWNDREHHPDRALARTLADRHLRPHLRQAHLFGPVHRLRHRPGGNVNRARLNLRLWRRPDHNRHHLRRNQADSVNRLPLGLHRYRQPDRRRHPAAGMSLPLLNLRLCRRRLDHGRHRPSASGSRPRSGLRHCRQEAHRYPAARVSRPHSGRHRCRHEARHLRLRADNASQQR